MLERKWLRLRYRLKSLAGESPRRVAFLHIPKCGGTTVFQHFKSNIGGGRSGRIVRFDSAQFAEFSAPALEDVRRAQFVSGHFGWNATAASGDDAFRFTVLRDPFERLVSLYRFSRLKENAESAVFEAVFEAAKQRSFGDFCLSPEPELKSMIQDAMTRALADDYFPYQDADPVRTLRAAIDHIHQLDLVIDLRNLNAAMPKLAEITGTRLASRPIWENRTPSEQIPMLSWAEFESDNALMNVIGLDRMLYRYAFSPFSPEYQPFAADHTPAPRNELRPPIN
ncbi:MAG: sulfotransferase family 2 domain-containing protein [Terricaulis sp.]